MQRPRANTTSILHYLQICRYIPSALRITEGTRRITRVSSWARPATYTHGRRSLVRRCRKTSQNPPSCSVQDTLFRVHNPHTTGTGFGEQTTSPAPRGTRTPNTPISILVHIANARLLFLYVACSYTQNQSLRINHWYDGPSDILCFQDFLSSTTTVARLAQEGDGRQSCISIDRVGGFFVFGGRHIHRNNSR